MQWVGDFESLPGGGKKVRRRSDGRKGAFEEELAIGVEKGRKGAGLAPRGGGTSRW